MIAEFEAVRQLIDAAVQPVVKDPDLRKKCHRLLTSMVKALRSAEGQRVLAGEIELLVKQLVAAGKAQ